MPGITAVTMTTLTEAVVTFDATIRADPNLHSYGNSTGNKWSIVPGEPLAAPSTIYDVEVKQGLTSAVVWFSPPLSPGRQYSITATQIEMPDTQNVITSTATFTTPAIAQVALGKEWSHGIFRALTRAVAETMQELSGRPATMLLADVAADHKHIFAESTIGFPKTNGHVWVGNTKYFYETKQPASFRDIKPVEPAPKTQPGKQPVFCSVSDILAKDSKQHLTSSAGPVPPGDGKDGVF